MKLIELFVVEATEYLPTHYYGSWINSKTLQIHPVDDEEHIFVIEYIRKNTENSITHLETPNGGQGEIFHYIWGYTNGFVRAVHTGYDSEYLGISGRPGDIKKVWPLVRPTAIKSDIINFDILGQFNTTYNTIKYKEFRKFNADTGGQISDMNQWVAQL